MDVDDLVLGGYLAVPLAEREGWQSELLPARFVSVSECLTGVRHGPEFCAWHAGPEPAARRPGTLLAIGFTRTGAAELAEQVARDHGPPECRELLEAGIPLPDGARLRGFEVIGVEYALSSVHSWLCHRYEPDVAAELGIRTNRWGLLGTAAQAAAVLAWMDDLPAEEAPEPVFWTVAAIAACG